MRLAGPTLAGAGAIGLWAFLALLARLAAAVPPFALVACCFAVSAAGGLFYLAITGRLREVRQPPLAWLHAVGGLFGYHAMYFAALQLAPAAQANLINYAWPLLIVLLSAALLGMKLRVGHLVGIGLGLGGCVLLLSGDARFSAAASTGYALAFGSAVIWAGYSVLSRRMAAVPTGALAGFCAVTSALAYLCHLLFEPAAVIDGRAWAVILLLGAGPLGGAFFLWDVGMKQGDPRLLGILAYITPVASTLLLIAAGLAPFTVLTLVAAGLVAGGGLVAARS